MKIRYAAQIRQTDCGPTALLNLMKWLGFRASLRKHHRYLTQICMTDDFGTSEFSLNRSLIILRKGRFHFKYRKRPKLSELEAHLARGGSALLIHLNEQGLHVSFIPEMDKQTKTFTVVNGILGKTVATVPRQTIKRWLHQGAPVYWLVTRYSIDARKPT